MSWVPHWGGLGLEKLADQAHYKELRIKCIK